MKELYAGKYPSKKKTYYGYNIHVLTAIDGDIPPINHRKSQRGDREGLYCITILGDKGDSGRAICEAMAEQGITLRALKPSYLEITIVLETFLIHV